MEDLSSKLMEMLNNPESMEKIKKLTGILNNNSNIEKQTDLESPEKNVNTQLSALPPDMLNTMMKLMPILSSINNEDENTKFLFALKPLLSEKRKQKVDQSIKIMQMIRILPLLKKQGIF